LVELLTTHPNTFDITVPTTNSGTRLLCSIVDNVEALIDEWFPGLRDIYVIDGTQLVTPLSLCPFCNGEPWLGGREGGRERGKGERGREGGKEREGVYPVT
jgi:hypothetical protein